MGAPRHHALALRAPAAALVATLGSCTGAQTATLAVAQTALETRPRPAHAPRPAPPPPRPAHCAADEAPLPTGCLALRGTRWRVKADLPTGGERIFVMELREDGHMIDGDPADTTPDDDEWSQQDDALHVYFNGRYAHYQATVRNRAFLAGTATNRVNERWTWLASQVFER